MPGEPITSQSLVNPSDTTGFREGEYAHLSQMRFKFLFFEDGKP
jgi:hypothetical protein